MKRIFLFTAVSFFMFVSCRRDEAFRVLQFNIWQEGTMVVGGYEGIIQQIIDSQADIVMLSEVRNYQHSRFCDRIIQSMKERGKTFYSFYSYDSGILSRYPIKDSAVIFPENGDHGSIHKAVVDVNGQEVAVYTAHLDYLNCAYYMVKSYDGNTWEKYEYPVTNLDTILQVNTASQRDDAIRVFLKAAAVDRQQGRVVILGGDFNEPSYRDWSKESADLFDRQGLVIPWTVTTLLEENGFVDAYRSLYPNPVTHPGITYPADCSGADVKKLTWAPDTDERERIDFIFYTPSERLQLKDAMVWGPSSSISRSQRVPETGRDKFGIGAGVWPSDHKAVLACYVMKK